jgi:hypothetical protein
VERTIQDEAATEEGAALAMTLDEIRARITVGDEEMVPLPALFRHESRLHGQAHVARVLVHALRLVATLGWVDEAPRVWAAVYLHDIARTHDGRSPEHGARGWARLADLPDVQTRFARGGVGEADYPAIQAAVTIHSFGELPRDDPHWRLAALLKDADALDRVRLGDLKSKWLRLPESTTLIPFASDLFEWSTWHLAPGPDYFRLLWEGARAHLESRPWPVP